MAATELEKTLKRMKVSVKATELAATPACGFSPTSRPWRVTLSRTEADKTVKLTITVLSGTEPNASTVVKCLAADVESCERTLWDFAQEFNQGETDEPTERMYKSVKRIGSRIKRFFGNSWANVASKAA
ncbi:Uncharacterised protein [uncultured archaeon]|nr:Uncharacterised protein [uncultured archaeon]